MTYQEQLIQFIHNLTDEEADRIIAYLKKFEASEEVLPHLLHCTAPQEQVIAV